jgi:exonuclease SbcC
MLRNNCKIGLLVIDEPAGLDSRGLDEFINIITSLSSEYNQILIISHIDELTNAFPSTIFVSQGTSGSEVCIK